MNISEAAVKAGMVAQYLREQGRDDWVPFEEMPDEFLERYRANALLILEAAAPYMLNDMRPMTLVEIAARERPESMAAARQKLIQDRGDSRREMTREARAAAWDEGYKAGELDGAYGTNDHEPPQWRNPYRSQA